MFMNRLRRLSVDSFNKLMQRADILLDEENVEGLKDLIRLVLRPIQSAHLVDSYLSAAKNTRIQLSPWLDLGIEGPLTVVLKGKIVNDKNFIAWCCSDTCLVDNKSIFPQLQLSTDVVLPTPWHPKSLISNIGSIGPGRPCGIFRQDPNHAIMYHYPLMIGWVDGGNHSIMQGILHGGSVVPDEVYDISPIINAVKFDGVGWLCCHSGNPMGTPRYPEFGWCWEIAKRITLLESSPYRK